MKKLILLGLLLGNGLYAEDFEQRGSMIYDAKTELSWEANPSSQLMNWEDAKKHCEDLELRLPNLYELKSLVDYTKYNPAIRTSLIDIKTDDWYWSSSPYLGKKDSSSAWHVDFYNGPDSWDRTTNTYYVLCVSGQ
jgi:hypothetical protein